MSGTYQNSVRMFSLNWIISSCSYQQPIFNKANKTVSFRGEAIPRVKSLIEDMPLILQQDVSYEQTKDVLEKVRGSLSKDKVDDSENAIWKCNFVFL